MSFSIRHRLWKRVHVDPPLERLESLLDELENEDEEPFVDALVTHDSGWELAANHAGRLIWRHGDQARHMLDVPREKVLQLWTMLVRGEIGAVDAEPWIDGTGGPPAS